jgi:hypothetical protein
MFEFSKQQKVAVLWRRKSALQWPLVVVLVAINVQTAVSQSPLPSRTGDVEAMLVKNILTAVNHGNITGNYTVLRDLGSVGFREKNTAAQLAVIFRNLREQKVDLSPILTLDPQFTQAPTLNQAGQLELVGFFPTQPLQVRFGLAFQRVEAGWMIHTISVGAVDPQPAHNTSPADLQGRLPQPYAR